MKISCKIEIEFDTKGKAEAVSSSIKVDDENYVRTDIVDNVLVATITADSVPSLNHTIEDYMACLSIAEKAID